MSFSLHDIVHSLERNSCKIISVVARVNVVFQGETQESGNFKLKKKTKKIGGKGDFMFLQETKSNPTESPQDVDRKRYSTIFIYKNYEITGQGENCVMRFSNHVLHQRFSFDILKFFSVLFKLIMSFFSCCLSVFLNLETGPDRTTYGSLKIADNRCPAGGAKPWSIEEMSCLLDKEKFQNDFKARSEFFFRATPRTQRLKHVPLSYQT